MIELNDSIAKLSDVYTLPEGLSPAFNAFKSARMTNRKLSLAEKWEVLVRRAVGQTCDEIVKWLATRNKKISRIGVYEYEKRYPEIIQALRKEYLKHLSAIPIAHKVTRLIYLQEEYRKSQENRRRRMFVDKDGGEHYFEAESPTDAFQAIREARYEVEGDPRGGHNIKIDTSGEGDVQVSIVDIVKQGAEIMRREREARPAGDPLKTLPRPI